MGGRFVHLAIDEGAEYDVLKALCGVGGLRVIDHYDPSYFEGMAVCRRCTVRAFNRLSPAEATHLSGAAAKAKEAIARGERMIREFS
jgi:hypothetical protein